MPEFLTCTVLLLATNCVALLIRHTSNHQRQKVHQSKLLHLCKRKSKTHKTSKKMKLPEKLKLLAIPAVIINSMLISIGTAQAYSSRGFTPTCTDLSYKVGKLSAKCRGIDGGYRTSSVDLNKSISNQDGVLVWSKEGNYIDSSNNCQTIIADRTITSHLWCDRVKATDGQEVFATLMLDEHIENVDGQLQYYYQQEFYGKNLANIQIKVRLSSQKNLW